MGSLSFVCDWLCRVCFVILLIGSLRTLRGPSLRVNGPLGSANTRNLAITLITNALPEHLLANGRAERAAIDQGDGALDFKPVVKLFTPDAQCTSASSK
jgi:Protein of unknown function (DUF2958)